MKKYIIKLRKGEKGPNKMEKDMYGKDMYGKNLYGKEMKMDRGMYGKKINLGKTMEGSKNYFSDSGRNWFKNPPESFKVMNRVRGRNFKFNR